MTTPSALQWQGRKYWVVESTNYRPTSDKIEDAITKALLWKDEHRTHPRKQHAKVNCVDTLQLQHRLRRTCAATDLQRWWTSRKHVAKVKVSSNKTCNHVSIPSTQDYSQTTDPFSLEMDRAADELMKRLMRDAGIHYASKWYIPIQSGYAVECSRTQFAKALVIIHCHETETNLPLLVRVKILDVPKQSKLQVYRELKTTFRRHQLDRLINKDTANSQADCGKVDPHALAALARCLAVAEMGISSHVVKICDGNRGAVPCP